MSTLKSKKVLQSMFLAVCIIIEWLTYGRFVRIAQQKSRALFVF